MEDSRICVRAVCRLPSASQAQGAWGPGQRAWRVPWGMVDGGAVAWPHATRTPHREPSDDPDESDVG